MERSYYIRMFTYNTAAKRRQAILAESWQSPWGGIAFRIYPNLS